MSERQTSHPIPRNIHNSAIEVLDKGDKSSTGQKDLRPEAANAVNWAQYFKIYTNSLKTITE